MLMEPIAPDDLALAEESIGETESKLKEYRNLLKNWIKCQPHLPSATYDERLLDTFLRGCKHNLERAKSKVDSYYTARSIYPELFGGWNSNSEALKQSLENFYVIPLPKPTSAGCRITFHKFVTSDPCQFNAKEVFRSMFMIGDIRLVEEPPVFGDIFVFDVKNISSSHLPKLATPLLKRTLSCTQNAYPQRLKEIHLINAPSIVDKVVSLFKAILKEKIRQRFHIHTSHETLYNFIPRSHLPKDYGGDLETCAALQSKWIAKVKNYNEYFQLQSYVKSDESKRVNDEFKILSCDKFGTEGAFRNLEID